MARKKETPIPIKIKDSAINISGNVNIEVRKGSSTLNKLKLNNSGTFRLFTGLLQFLRGDYSTSINGMGAYLPYYLGVGSQQPPTPTDTTMTGLVAELQIGERIRIIPSGIAISNDLGKASLTFTALIPYASVGDTWLTELGMFSSKYLNTNTMLARVTLPKLNPIDPHGVKLQQGQSLFVQWTINIQNI